MMHLLIPVWTRFYLVSFLSAVITLFLCWILRDMIFHWGVARCVIRSLTLKICLWMASFLPNLVDPLRLKIFISDGPSIYAYLMSSGVSLRSFFISKVLDFSWPEFKAKCDNLGFECCSLPNAGSSDFTFLFLSSLDTQFGFTLTSFSDDLFRRQGRP